ncbi:hypothetical protein, unlikely [Trypanosoma brucei gambiense DAL972]|uniref:Uncharacterized protein n=1 Tax=Trypanosoma brucei gambiense (strain MHOM/CI/86/DAL972) TaxID=679716 RepID=C9ZUH9_TRYB9|nr:hypothetical protein, unlikely [Trypanosoma brucei gambiense DAL972]CBH13067.1 hypothetical protein, unlikely [Trypanosoma brucei gambiense DAL972]|eukprot:XP_011775344.1 hypothetical protein, unlikely [Trypanosoma brucei gambiense DAL972]
MKQVTLLLRLKRDTLCSEKNIYIYNNVTIRLNENKRNRITCRHPVAQQKCHMQFVWGCLPVIFDKSIEHNVPQRLQGEEHHEDSNRLPQAPTQSFHVFAASSYMKTPSIRPFFFLPTQLLRMKPSTIEFFLPPRHTYP